MKKYLAILFIIACNCTQYYVYQSHAVPVRKVVQLNRVFDGDTISYTDNGKEYKLRLIDVECDEVSYASQRATKLAAFYNLSLEEEQRLGLLQKKYLTDLLVTSTNKLSVYVTGQDVYGRNLGYAYDGETNVNDVMRKIAGCHEYVRLE